MIRKVLMWYKIAFELFLMRCRINLAIIYCSTQNVCPYPNFFFPGENLDSHNAEVETLQKLKDCGEKFHKNLALLLLIADGKDNFSSVWRNSSYPHVKIAI